MTEHDASRGHNGTTHHPILDRPAPRPAPLPPRPTPRSSEERAEAYASITLQQLAVEETTYRELDEMRSAIIILDARTVALRGLIREDIREALGDMGYGRSLPRSERDTIPPPGDLPPMREQEGSWHDYDAEFEKARLLLHARVNEPSDRMTSDRARAIAKEVVSAAKDGSDAAVWRRLKSWPAWLAAKGAEHAISLLVGGGLVLLWHWLSRH